MVYWAHARVLCATGRSLCSDGWLALQLGLGDAVGGAHQDRWAGPPPGGRRHHSERVV